MKESEFWKIARTGLLAIPSEQKIFLQRIENGSGRGQGDVNAGFCGDEVWLELKVMKGNQIEIRFSQFAWARERFRSSLSNMFVVALHKNHVKVWHTQTLMDSLAISGNKGRVTKKSLVFVPPCPDFWMDVKGSWLPFRKYIFGS